MNSTGRTVAAPKYFKANSIIGFISDCSAIFTLAGKQERYFFLDLNRVKECSMIGLLIIYKIMEFSTKNDCFLKPSYLMSSEFKEALTKYGFSELILSYLDDKIVAEKDFANLKISVTDNFIIAPQALLRNDRYSAEILNKKYLPQIEDYYLKNPKAIKMIFLCFSEILLNFWEHAVDDTQSIIVANGSKSNIEIACADNGKGVLSTLTLAGKAKKDKLKTFLSATKKGVTSKDTSNHMGYGLWIIDEVVRKTNGKFHLYSEGYYYQRELGKINFGSCGAWQGTIVYLSIPLNNPVTLCDIEDPGKNSNFNLQINWL